jgi:hypothetical protein
MPREFLLISQDEIDLKTAENLHAREMELLSYDLELEHHTNSVASLKHLQWDQSLLKYRGLSRDAMIAKAMADGLSSEQIQKVSDLNTLDFHLRNIEAVRVETAKSERIYGHLKNALPPERRAAAFAAFRNRRATGG